MKCNLCKKNPASIFVQAQEGLGMDNVQLCLPCALKKGLNIKAEDVDGFIKNFLANLFGRSKIKHFDPRVLELVDRHCTQCSTSIHTIMEEKMIGCEFCITEFEPYINHVLFQQNNSTEYKGKLPKNLQEKKTHKQKVVTVQKAPANQFNKIILNEQSCCETN